MHDKEGITFVPEPPPPNTLTDGRLL